MNDADRERQALQPLWMLSTGGATAAILTALVPVSCPTWLSAVLGVVGGASLCWALHEHPRAGAAWWLLAGLCLIGWRGLGAASAARDVQRRLALHDPSVRARVVIDDGWRDATWGLQTRVRVLEATLGGAPLAITRHSELEVRGSANAIRLPPPGAVVEVLARVRGSPGRPLLVASSDRLIRDTGRRQALPMIRDVLTRRVLAAAGSDVDRLRAAESAAALALGRRFEIPTPRRERWRRSGLAHVLAVSGLHVGLVGASVWLLIAWLGASPNATRWLVMLVIPAYAVLAGAAPSALRAALMAVIYLGARLVGRAVLPIAAVSIAFFLLLLVRPQLILEPGFQLTVVIAAALVRWVPPLARTIPGPRGVAGALVVPLVAQIAALPIVGWHFRSLIPGAVLANLAALPLIGPTVLLSAVTATVAPLWAGAAALGLELVHLLTSALLACAAGARICELTLPQLPVAVVPALVLCGWFALQPGRRGVAGAAGWVGVLLLTAAFLLPRSLAAPPTVELLPVSDGTAVVLRSGASRLLVDGGRSRREGVRLLVDTRTRRLDAILATHTDEDHIGGLAAILTGIEVDRLLLPAWMTAAPEAVPLLRAARSRGTSCLRIARGVAVNAGTVRVESVWPPLVDPPRRENERSVVARVLLAGGRVLVTSDIGSTTEVSLARRSSLDCEVLVVPHHGSRGSTSSLLLARTTPEIALIPAGEGNRHGHPHAEVLQRLQARSIVTRWPARHGACGARWNGVEWRAFP